MSTSLSSERTSFVGRGDELARLHELVSTGSLATLVGPGGFGKTRLARRYWRKGRRHRGRVWFCDLADARNAAELLAVVGDALDVDFVRGATLDAIARQLGHAINARGRPWGGISQSTLARSACGSRSTRRRCSPRAKSTGARPGSARNSTGVSRRGSGW